jgi:adenylate kinase
MFDFIFIAGCPGSGKTTVSRLIHQYKQELWPIIDFGRLREFHLNHQWTNASDLEEQMTFENLIFILKNYHRHSYKNILINDLTDKRIGELSNYLPHHEYNYLIITLVVNNVDILSARVSNPDRDSGWRNVQRSIEWNNQIQQRSKYENEYILDNTYLTPEETMMEILKLIT